MSTWTWRHSYRKFRSHTCIIYVLHIWCIWCAFCSIIIIIFLLKCFPSKTIILSHRSTGTTRVCLDASPFPNSTYIRPSNWYTCYVYRITCCKKKFWFGCRELQYANSVSCLNPILCCRVEDGIFGTSNLFVRLLSRAATQFLRQKDVQKRCIFKLC